MNSVNRVKSLCKKNKIPISRLEKDLNFANGYISQLKKGSFPAERLQKIADYFNVSMDFLISDENNATMLNQKDSNDIAQDLNAIMRKLELGEDGPIHYNGQEIDDNTYILFKQAMELGLTQLKLANKELYNPNKNKK